MGLISPTQLLWKLRDADKKKYSILLTICALQKFSLCMRRHVEATYAYAVTDARCKSGGEGGGAQCRDEGCGQVVVLPTCLQIQGLGIRRIGVAQLRRLALGFDLASTVYNRLDRLDACEPTPSYLNQPTTSLIPVTASHDLSRVEAMILWHQVVP